MSTRPVGIDAATAVADAVMYEGYLLYPYRRSSGKNRVRWQFGVLTPPEWARAHGLDDDGVAGSAESPWQQTECLLEAHESARVRIRLRFLHLQRKSVETLTAGGEYQPVDRMEVGGQTELSFDEAVPREYDIDTSITALLGGPQRVDVEIPGGEEITPLPDGLGRVVGRVARRRWSLSASIEVSATACRTPFRALRLRARVRNTDATTAPDCAREQALRRCLLAAHTLIWVRPGRFLSLLDPPEWAREAAERCHNVHTFPVLAGAEDGADVTLSAPIILYDHPRIAPESPGDLHDATEIDEILSLRALTLSDAEKSEARATDPRAAGIVDRIDSMPPEVLERLHGAIRSLRAVRSATAAADSATADSGANRDARADGDDAVTVAGVRLAKGSPVRLRPRRRGTDAHDIFLAGRTGRVQEVLRDIDGTRFLAVTVDDDPGAELHQWYGRLRHFRPEEVEPLDSPTEGDGHTAGTHPTDTHAGDGHTVDDAAAR